MESLRDRMLLRFRKPIGGGFEFYYITRAEYKRNKKEIRKLEKQVIDEIRIASFAGY